MKKDEIPGTAVYGLLFLLESITTYTAVTFIPVAHLDAIKISSIVASGLILFSVFYEEKVTILRVCFAFICIGGIYCVTQPNFKFGKTTYSWANVSVVGTVNETVGNNITNGNHENSSNTILTILAYCLSVASGIFTAGFTLVFKLKPHIGQNILQVSFWSFLCSSIVSTIIMIFVEKPVLPKTWEQTLLICVHSLCCATNIISYIYGLQYISANSATILSCAQVVMMLIPQYTILSSIYPGHRNWIEVAGVVLVLLGSGMESLLELIGKNTYRT